MKVKPTIFLLLILFSVPSLAQVEITEKTFKYSNQELDLDMDFGDGALIKAWDKNEIYVKVSYEINGGDLNDAMDLDIDDYGDKLSIDVDLDKRKLRGARSFGCNSAKNGTYYNGDGYNVCSDIIVEVFLPKKSDLWINTVVADVVVEGMQGDIEIETVTGKIDVSLPSDVGAEVKMKTVTGDVYTNLEFESRRRNGLKIISGHDIRGTYKSGEKEVNLETVTSDIYLRRVSDR